MDFSFLKDAFELRPVKKCSKDCKKNVVYKKILLRVTIYSNMMPPN